MRFAREQKENSGRIVIDAPTWFDACRVLVILVGEGDDAKKYDGPDDPTIEARWVGHDAGRVAQRRLEVREMKDGQWTEWRSL